MTTTSQTATDTGPALRLLSLGAGVQSTTVLLLACEGEIPRFDVALFADTGWEPRAVYTNLDRLTAHAERHGIPVRQVSAGNIRADALDPKHRFVSMPLHTLNPDGSRGLARRQCTAEYKITPLKRAARELLGYPHPRRVPRGVYAEQAIGISTDEFTRAKDSGLRFLRNVFPLIDLGFDRARCMEFLAERGFGETVKSACVGCLMWNLSWLRCLLMITVRWERYPLVERHPEAYRWLQFTANIGRAWNTVDAYGRAVDDHLAFCLTLGTSPEAARPDAVAAWIGDMHQRPNRNGGVGLANSTIQVRIVGVRSFYDFLVEEGIRERNPVRRGQSSRRGHAKQGLVRRVEKAPWIPNEHAWDRILRACEHEPVRNRLMVTVAYDGALRREELVSLEPGDLEPAWSLIHLRAETTKSKRAREVSFGTTSAQLLVAYLRRRGELFGRVDSGLFLSESRRNRGEQVGRSSWSKIVTGIATRAGVPQLSTHTFRHLRLTDLARAGWSIDEIAQYAGHRDLSTTLKYIHLSGRELAAKLHKATRSLQADRERRLAAPGGGMVTDKLSVDEREALAKTYDQSCPRSSEARRLVLHRLLEPIDEVTGHWRAANVARVRNTVLSRVHKEQQPYWCWGEATWIDLAEQAGMSGDRGCRGPVVAVANLLGLHRTLHHHVRVQESWVAELVFGRDATHTVITEVVDTLRSWDASRHTVIGQIPAALSDLLLVTGTPRLQGISEQQVRDLADRYPKGGRRSGLIKISRVLAHLGIIAQPLHGNDAQRGPRPDTLSTVPPSWLDWAQRWRALSTHEPGTIRGMFSVILIAGRWAAEKQPEALAPHLWTRDIAAEYVADTLHAVHGQWAGHNRNTTKKGQPLTAVGKVQRIDSLRGFFSDLIDWEWIKPKFDPRKVLCGPVSVLAQIGPNPRIIDEVSWAKLMAAGLTLNSEDLNEYGTPRAKAAADGRRLYYPIEMVRALVGVWLFAGCRIDEIRRLDIDCIDRDEGRDEQTGETFPICLLRVPQNKTSRPFSKPVDPIVGQLIDAWKHVRPVQPKIVDRKTGEHREFLFCVRGEQIGRAYLNDTVLPALCRKAGIPEFDSRGALTSHRARSTIATQLLNAPEPLSIADLKEWLGHKHFSSTRHYAAILQRRLTAAYRKADYFARNVRTIQVLIDRETILSGAATGGEQPWKYYDLGEGYCTYDFFAKCQHRLACARCPFYLPKQSSAGQLLAVREGVEQMLERLTLTDDERDALEGDRDALAALAERLAKVPTPAGPTPEQLGADRAFVALTVVQDSITGGKA